MRGSDYEEMDQLATARSFAEAAYRVHRAEDIGRGVARAIRTAVSGRPDGVYLDIPAAVLGEIIEAQKAAASVWRVVDPAPRQAPEPGAVDRAIYLRAHAEPSLVVLGEGAAYAQADEPIREFIETTGVPYLPMSMAKGLLPDDHPQSEATARSLALRRADVVMLVGARLNWLLGHGEAPQWSPDATIIQVDISATELDSNQAIAAPLVGDVGSVMEALVERSKPGQITVSKDWRDELAARSAQSIAKMAGRIEAAATAHPMKFVGAPGDPRRAGGQPGGVHHQRGRQRPGPGTQHGRHGGSATPLADELNLSYADVHGVVTFDHDFRTESAGRTTDRVCQAVGARGLVARLREQYGVAHGEPTPGRLPHGRAVFCLGRLRARSRRTGERPHLRTTCPQYKVTAVRVTRTHAVTGEQRESAARRSTTGQVVG